MKLRSIIFALSLCSLFTPIFATKKSKHFAWKKIELTDEKSPLADYFKTLSYIAQIKALEDEKEREEELAHKMHRLNSLKNTLKKLKVQSNISHSLYKWIKIKALALFEQGGNEKTIGDLIKASRDTISEYKKLSATNKKSREPRCRLM